MKYPNWIKVSLYLCLFASSCASPTKRKNKHSEHSSDLKTKSTKNKCHPDLPFCAIGPIANIAGKDLPAKRYNERLDGLSFHTGNSQTRIDRVKKTMLEYVIFLAIVKHDTQGKMNLISKEEAEVDYLRVRKHMEDQGYDYHLFLERTGNTADEFKTNLIRGLVIKKLFPEIFEVRVRWEDVKSYYDLHTDDYTRRDFNPKYVLIPVQQNSGKKGWSDAAEKVKTFLVQVQNKPDVSEFIRDSFDTLESGSLTKSEFEKYPKSLDHPNESIHSVERTKEGYLIIYQEWGVASLIPYETVKEEIATHLKKIQMTQANDKYLEARKDQLQVKVFDRNIVYNLDFHKKKNAIQAPQKSTPK